MEGHRPKKLLDQVRAYPELGEGMPSASNAGPIARSRRDRRRSRGGNDPALC